MELWGLPAEDVLFLQFEALEMVLRSCRKYLSSATSYVCTPSTTSGLSNASAVGMVVRVLIDMSF